ncbi:MAG: peptide ABC transporter substrate-binding protein, partial [Chloroflexota bacterium]|nr:peptide ABC transporter substrate-binding protein [Chloroflexota bacterium]
ELDLRIAGAAPSTWDPAAAGDVGSASTLAQVFEGLTAFDANSQAQPALAQSWSVEQGGRRIVFRLRPGLQFSDGSSLTAEDVVSSWLRLLDPRRRSPLASLLDDVAGAVAYGRWEAPAERVGLRAEGDRVVVDLRRPASYFVSVTASPSLAVVPADTGSGIATKELPRGLVASGAYRPTAQTKTTIRLEANPHYWAGQPPLRRIEVVTDLEGRSPVDVFAAEDLDYTAISSADASWIRYDRTLGPQLRRVESFSVTYYGFDTTRRPFDDPRARRAFAQAVDWHRLVRLADPESTPATSLVPPGVPGRSATDFTPRHDPAAARQELAAAGFPGGRNFPEVTLVSSGSPYDEGVVHELKQVLGVTVRLEVMPFEAYFERLETEVPAFWNLAWVADYPAPQDFLGLLAETGSSNNYGRWSNRSYDDAVAAAAQTTALAEQQRQYDAAQAILRDDAGLVPVSYGQGWALSSPDLLGANQSGVGFIRLAGLAWAP